MDTLNQLRAALQAVKDPELGFSIIDLGLVYDIGFDDAEGQATILLTLTTPFCPAQDQLRQEISEAVKTVPGVKDATINLTFDPPWSGQKATPEIQQQFALMGIPLTR